MLPPMALTKVFFLNDKLKIQSCIETEAIFCVCCCVRKQWLNSCEISIFPSLRIVSGPYEGRRVEEWAFLCVSV